jgi:hypothetical protein
MKEGVISQAFTKVKLARTGIEKPLWISPLSIGASGGISCYPAIELDTLKFIGRFVWLKRNLHPRPMLHQYIFT